MRRKGREREREGEGGRGGRKGVREGGGKFGVPFNVLIVFF